MKSIFLDTNVLIDFFADRKPFSIDAARLFDYSLKKKIKMLNEISEWTNVIDLTKEIIHKSLTSDFKDFEDAIQYHCAKSINKIDLIVTRDTKDYKVSSLPILTPKEAVALIESTSK